MKGLPLRVIQSGLKEDKESGSTEFRSCLGSVIMAKVLEGADLQEGRKNAREEGTIPTTLESLKPTL